MGAAIGAGAGAAAALAGVLFTRGPEAVLAKGTTIEMILDRQVRSTKASWISAMRCHAGRAASDGGGPLPSHKSQQAYPRPDSALSKVPST